MLIRFELMKIVRRRSTLAVLAVSLLLTALMFGLPVLQYQTYTQDGAVRGLEGIALERARTPSVTLTDETVEALAGEYRRLFDDPQNVGYDGAEQFLIGSAYWDFVAPREQLLGLIAKTYDAPGETSGMNGLLRIGLEGGARFEEARMAKIEATLADASYAMTQAEQGYWRALSSRVQTPLRYGYYEGWSILISSFELLMFALVAVCIALAPVFAGEVQAGMDALLLAARYGRSRLIAAKAAAAMIFALLAFTLHAALAFGIPLAAFGTQGWDLPVQAANTAIPYPLTFLQAALLQLGIAYLVLLALAGLTLLLSAAMRSPYAVLTVIVPVCFVPMFLSPNGTKGLYNAVAFLLPYRSLTPELGKYVSFALGGMVIDVFAARAALYAVLAAALPLLSRRVFGRRQVGG